MSMAAGARAGARLLQLRSSTPFLRGHLPSSAAVAPSNLTPSRGFAADHGHGPARVNIWEDPLSPSKWKEEHFVFVSLTGWGLLIYGGYKAATGGSWFLLFYGGYKAATGGSKPKPVPKVGPPKKPVVNAEPLSKRKEEKPVSKKKDDFAPKQEGNLSPKKKEDKPAPKKEDKPASKKEDKLASKRGETPAPKKEGRSVSEKKEEKPPPKKKEENKPDLKNLSPKEKKGPDHDIFL